MYYDPSRHHRQSIRLKGYDYSRPGRYFITINVKNRKLLFGHVLNQKMILNDAGKMVETWYFEMTNKYPNILLCEHVVMPNHFHTIIEIMDIPLYGHPKNDIPETEHGRPYGPNNKKYNASIFDMMDWFKTMTTNAYIRGVKIDNWPRFDRKLWQPRYHDHIIRSTAEFNRIKKYILANPANWNRDIGS